MAHGDAVNLWTHYATCIQHKVSLQGISAAEKVQALEQRFKEHLFSQVFGCHVTVQYDKRDRYDRFVGKVLLEGTDINRRQQGEVTSAQQDAQA